MADRSVETAGYADEAEESLTWEHLRRFVEAPLRRPLAVLVPWAAIFALSVLALFVLPKKYRSSTLILIESEKVPDSFVPKVSTEDTSRRIENIKPEILSRTRLETVLAETRPYPDIASLTVGVDTMRRAIAINVSGNDAFTIEFVHRDAQKAREVADRLATLFIDETIKSRGRQVEDAVDFLVTQVDGARNELEQKDEAQRRFKEERMGRLPEQLQTNLATLNMLQRELQSAEESLLLARERQESLARGIGQSVSSGGPRGIDPSPASSDLAELRRQLAALRGRYTDEHPDVQSVRSRLARLEAQMAAAASGDQSVADPDPSVAIAREQLERATLEVKNLEKKRTDLEARATVLRSRVEETPRTEQEMATLTRDYEKLKENYTSLLSKQLDAQMAGRMEHRWKGDRFRVLDPANLPDKPSFPKPLLVLGMGGLFGLMVGLGACLAMEFLDPTVKNAEELSTLGSFPVLARIPHLRTPAGQLRS
ncbi:MAG: GNVR domain-containing protein [Vicinamibacteria bacterium]